MELEQNKKATNKGLSWKILLPVGILLWVIFYGGAVGILGVIITAVGIVRLITDLVKHRKK